MLDHFEKVRTPTGEISGFLYRAKAREFEPFLVVMLPPATGNVLPLAEEAQKLASDGYSILIVLPSYARRAQAEKIDSTKSIRETKPDWSQNLKEIQSLIGEAIGHEAESLHQNSSTKIILMGQNLGGSLAAMVAQTGHVHAMVSFGSLPCLSEFWQKSTHPAAVSARQRTDSFEKRSGGSKGSGDSESAEGNKNDENDENDLNQAADSSTQFDLVRNLGELHIPVLLQFGHEDEWLDDDQKRHVEELSKRHTVQWYHDDHDMKSIAAREGRRIFCQQVSRLLLK